MSKKEMVAMLLAGGQGSRLGALTQDKAKPAVHFAGKYRIIDFPLSNCINSGVDTVGIMTQYKPLSLNEHVGIGIPWDLDRNDGGITVLTPYMSEDNGNWFMGTAHAVYSNINYLDRYNPEYVLILSGDHVYKMDYSKMLDSHKKNKADVTISVLPVPEDEAHRFGILNTDKKLKVIEFEEKPANPKSNLASMGIYIFSWQVLRKALIEDSVVHEDSDFGAHIIPNLINENKNIYAYKFEDYWRDVGTIQSYWETNLDLVKTVPEFNLYDDYWKIYTRIMTQNPHFIHDSAKVQSSIIGDGCEIYGEVYNCVLGNDIIVEKGAVLRDSIIIGNNIIKENTKITKSIICESSVIGNNTKIGNYEEVGPNAISKVYNTGISVIGEDSVVPNNVEIGNNCVITGITTKDDYTDNKLENGKNVFAQRQQVEVL